MMLIKFVMRESTKNKDVDILDLSTRSKRRLDKAKYETIGEVVENWDKLPRLSGMGENSIREIGNKILDLAVSEMTEDELWNFWFSLIQLNTCEDLRPVFEKFELVKRK